MAVTITTYPKKVIDSEAVQVSRWMAAWNNIIYKLQRKDFVITSIASDSGSPEKAVITVTGTLPSIDEGATVYVNSGAYVGNYTVLSSNTNTLTIDADYIGSSGGGYTNLFSTRPNYYVEIAMLQKSGTYSVYATDNRVADATGLITLDIASYVRSMLNMENESPYNERTYPDPNMSAIVNIKFKEFWEDYEGQFSSVDESEDYYIANAAMQKLNTYGSNMGEQVPFPPDLISPPIEQHKGKFLVDFVKPTYFEGYPFDMAFIYPKDFEDSDVRISLVEELYNINRSLQSSADDLIDQDTNKVVRAMLNGSYASTIKTVDVYLKAKEVTVGVKASQTWGSLSITGTSNVMILDIDNLFGDVAIGRADWQGDLDSTMDKVVESINTNTNYGTTWSAGSPAIFDNSTGYTASYDSGTKELTIYAPIVGTTYNGRSMMFVTDGGTWGGEAGSSKDLAGGVDGGVSDLQGLTTARVSEVKTVKIGNVCENPVYLCWHNKLGGKSYWLFQGMQEESITTKINSSINTYTEDLELQNTDTDIISISSGKDIIVGDDNVLKEDFSGMIGLKQSARVMMLVDVENLIWQTVIIKEGSMQLPDTDAEMGSVRFTLQLAEDNLPQQ